MEPSLDLPQKNSKVAKFKSFILTYRVRLIVGFLFLILAASGVYYFEYKSPKLALEPTQQNQQDIYSAFAGEVWDTIKTNYWDKITDEQLANLYKLGAEKILKNDIALASASKDLVITMIQQSIKTMEDSKKKEFVVNLSDIVLANLQPFGRSRLYGQKEEKQLRDTVTNINPQNDLYATIGTKKGASAQEVKTAYDKTAQALEAKKNKTVEEQQQLEKIKYAYQVLTNADQKQTYDQVGAEPTVFSKMISSNVAYISIKKISPQTFEEFQKVANDIKGTPDSLIIDLRGNIGGAVDTLPYFLGPFIGNNQYAYDFFHQGEYTPHKTKVGWLNSLVKYKKVIMLTDGNTQSSAEVMAATFKKYNVGVVIGTKTKGWGTIEQLMPLKTVLDPSEKYSILMVHSLTLRDDGQPIESRGVDPKISIEDKNWPKELMAYFNYPELIDAVKKAWEIK